MTAAPHADSLPASSRVSNDSFAPMLSTTLVAMEDLLLQLMDVYFQGLRLVIFEDG